MATICLDAGALVHTENMSQIDKTMSMLAPTFGIEYAQNAAALQFEQKAGIAEPSLINQRLEDLGTFQSMSIAQNAAKSNGAEIS